MKNVRIFIGLIIICSTIPLLFFSKVDGDRRQAIVYGSIYALAGLGYIITPIQVVEKPIKPLPYKHKK